MYNISSDKRLTGDREKSTHEIVAGVYLSLGPN